MKLGQFNRNTFLISIGGGGGGGSGLLPYSLGGGVPQDSRKSYPLLDQILQILWPYTRLKMLNCSWFQSFVSDPVKRDPTLDQFPMSTRPYTRLNGLKTIPFPAAHTRIANIWDYTPGLYLLLEVMIVHKTRKVLNCIGTTIHLKNLDLLAKQNCVHGYGLFSIK